MNTEDNLEMEIKSNLYLFYLMFVVSTFSNFSEAEHIRTLAIKLMEVSFGLIERLCIAMPPRHSKSSMVTLAFPLWLIFQNPNLNILIVNYDYGLSEKFGVLLREYIKIYGSYFDVYLSKEKQSKTYMLFCNSEGTLYTGSIRLVGVGGSITGHDADYVIIDDPYSGNHNDITLSALEKTIDWFNLVMEQRIEPTTKLIILHTRWHTYDLQGYLKENFPEDYEFVEFSAITQDGKPLWPEKYTIEDLEKKRERVGERIFQSIYQQKPLDDTSDFFDLDSIKWETPKRKIRNTCRAWDIASSDSSKGNLNDYTAGTKMHLLNNMEDVLITDLIHGQFGSKTKSKIQGASKRDGVKTEIVIETGVAAAGKLLFEEWEEQLKGFRVSQAIPIKSKVDRATPFKNAILDEKVYIDIKDEKTRDKLIEEFKSFPYGKHDDIVDSVVHAYNHLRTKKKKRIFHPKKRISLGR